MMVKCKTSLQASKNLIHFRYGSSYHRIISFWSTVWRHQNFSFTWRNTMYFPDQQNKLINLI